ncbi:MAG: 50S ribosomal protein L11 methyltransferase [Chlamydiia bacterium]
MWFELTVAAPADEAELLTQALFDFGAISVSTEDADRDTPDELPIFGEPGLEVPTIWRANILCAIFSPPILPEQVLAHLSAVCAAIPSSAYQVRPIAELDWVKHVQDQFTPVQISRTFWIVPTWCEVPDPNALVLRLDPGLAFGTGSHPTTGLCLRWLETEMPKQARVLDYGCGSGILALAAFKLGAREVYGTDIDPMAITSARQNAASNDVVADFQLPHAPQLEGKFDVVVANILANPLCELAPQLLARLLPGGSLVLSGILEAQAPAVIQAYAEASHGRIALHVWATEGGWVCLQGRLGSS